MVIELVRLFPRSMALALVVVMVNMPRFEHRHLDSCSQEEWRTTSSLVREVSLPPVPQALDSIQRICRYLSSLVVLSLDLRCVVVRVQVISE